VGNVKIALGMIVKSLDTDAEIGRFIDNAEKYGHKLDCAIAAYSRDIDHASAKALGERIAFNVIDVKNPTYCKERFRELGISTTATKALLECPVDRSKGLVPYGFNRTLVVIEALLRGVDILFFADNDVIPAVLKDAPGGPQLEEADFFGAHLKHLSGGAEVTTGEYSGYNILPPASFDGMEDLLHGVQKHEMSEYWKTSIDHKTLYFQPPDPEPKPCGKIHGGNTGLRLSAFSTLPPFFSSSYTVGGELYLCRGEDTILGMGMHISGTDCLDIGFNPLHDTYQGYPAVPDLRGDHAVQDRFYYACTGWVGRNPFFNYIRLGRVDSGIELGDLRDVRDFQRAKLEVGLRGLAEYTSNPRYLGILENFDVSWANLPRYVSEYKRVVEAWEELRQVISKKQ
jgi:hypothetical protein